MIVSTKIPNYLMLWFCITYLLLPVIIQADVYTAITDMKEVVKTAKDLHKFVDKYLEAERKRLELIQKKANAFLNAETVDIENAEEFLGNPINVFHLVKRLSIDWPKIENSLKLSSYETTVNSFIDSGGHFKLPDSEDLNGVALGLDRLQLTYQIPLQKFSKGEIAPGLKAIKELSAADCYDVALLLDKQDNGFEAQTWMEFALILESNETIKSVSRARILQTLSFNYFIHSNYSKAVEKAEELTKIDPTIENSLETFKEYQKKYKSTVVLEDDPDEDLAFRREFYIKYRQLCRNEHLLDPKVEAKFKCYYSTNNSPYLILQPTKVEDVHLNPWLAILHDVLNENEMEIIINISIPLLSRAEVDLSSEKGTKYKVSSGRIGKTAWLNDDDYFPLSKINRRLQEITGLDTSNSEPFQTVVYGIGGQYDPHVDFEEDKKGAYFEDMGRRIATVLYYMSDVLAGGATVFPSLNVTVLPKKGSAAFWYNLEKTGKGNYLTRHAGCPVLAGTKWVTNKWIHEYQQEFRKPCGLNKSHKYEK